MTSQVEDPNTTSHFDADAAAAAQLQPTITVGRYLYRGRLLSVEEWLPWWERWRGIEKALDAQKTGESNIDLLARMRALSQFYRNYLTLVFPRRRYRWWAPNPVRHLTAMPFVVVEEAVVRFFSLQVRATFGKDAVTEDNATRSVPPGTPSPLPTPSAPVETA